ncbi:uncharacterized protein LOC108956252 [Eucalyptus grandis]|uniref:uncharacterized protein LOC108956252 n=1 Tax=Eucalyptus grandis TaxID=71139 RepID=UPI00192EB107|nr:uncharacterized protein LOC108956252 [Eucalyptus grandis]
MNGELRIMKEALRGSGEAGRNGPERRGDGEKGGKVKEKSECTCKFWLDLSERNSRVSRSLRASACSAEVATIILENPSTNRPQESWHKQVTAPLFSALADFALSLPTKEASMFTFNVPGGVSLHIRDVQGQSNNVCSMVSTSCLHIGHTTGVGADFNPLKAP